MKYWLSLFCFLCLLPLQAKENFPKSCKPLVVKGEAFSLHFKKPQLILIKNRVKNDLWLSHPGVTSRMEPENWSALVVSKHKFSLNCIESTPGHEQQIACQDAIAACKLVKVKMPGLAAKVAFVAENANLSSVIDHLGENGFKW